MEPDEVVRASLIDLAEHVVVSIPPRADPQMAVDLSLANQTPLGACLGSQLADRHN